MHNLLSDDYGNSVGYTRNKSAGGRARRGLWCQTNGLDFGQNGLIGELVLILLPRIAGLTVEPPQSEIETWEVASTQRDGRESLTSSPTAATCRRTARPVPRAPNSRGDVPRSVLGFYKQRDRHNCAAINSAKGRPEPVGRRRGSARRPATRSCSRNSAGPVHSTLVFYMDNVTGRGVRSSSAAHVASGAPQTFKYSPKGGAARVLFTHDVTRRPHGEALYLALLKGKRHTKLNDPARKYMKAVGR
ncbi:hypothetical protein EVAR_94427_1 [Eumeta japonica]|uniref:Uncharacterized protein n=1 Tax=Eumeta variegata TaxID=151549 RepID=A0A4C1TQ48_EUMVA|nr:hypothetical protein EVAR_94427_1 [Eumeta japonica]